MLNFTLLLCIIIHNISCVWFYSAKSNNFSYDTWVVQSNLLDSSTGTQYLASVYWTFMTLSTVGYGDINPNTSAERLISMFVMVFGVTFFSLAVGSLSSVISTINTK